MRLEFVGGGPLDGQEGDCPSDVVRVLGHSQIPPHLRGLSWSSFVQRHWHHVYELTRLECGCGTGCGETQVAMFYLGVFDPNEDYGDTTDERIPR